jgi:hypothetical protein
MKKIAFIFVVALTIVFTSCKKDRFDNTDPKPEKMEELKVPSSFDWKTTKDIQLTLSAPTNGIIEVTNTQNIAYQKAFLTPGQAYTMKLTLPTFETKVKLKFSGQVIDLDISGTALTYQF